MVHKIWATLCLLLCGSAFADDHQFLSFTFAKSYLGYHEFAKELTLDFIKKEAVLTRAGDRKCIGSLKMRRIHKGNLRRIHVSFKNTPYENKGCHNADFTLTSGHFARGKMVDRGGSFDVAVTNILFLGRLRYFSVKRID